MFKLNVIKLKIFWGYIFFKTSKVKFSRLSENDLNEYLDTEEWRGKAGGYAIQSKASSFVPWISGSYTGVMGFPINEVKNVLISSGWKK